MFGFFRSHSSPQNDGSGGCSCSKQLLNHYTLYFFFRPAYFFFRPAYFFFRPAYFFFRPAYSFFRLARKIFRFAGEMFPPAYFFFRPARKMVPPATSPEETAVSSGDLPLRDGLKSPLKPVAAASAPHMPPPASHPHQVFGCGAEAAATGFKRLFKLPLKLVATRNSMQNLVQPDLTPLFFEGDGVRLQALSGSWGARIAPVEVRRAARIQAALDTLLPSPPATPPPTLILRDAAFEREARTPDPADNAGEAVWLVGPDFPGESLAFPLTRLLLQRLGGPKAVGAAWLLEGVATLAEAHSDPALERALQRLRSEPPNMPPPGAAPFPAPLPATAPLGAAPRGTIPPEAKHAAMGGSPAAMGGSPAAMGGSPAAMGGSPAAMGSSPAAMGGSPAAMGGSPAAMGGSPAAMGSSPAAMGGSPAAFTSAKTRAEAPRDAGHSALFVAFLRRDEAAWAKFVAGLAKSAPEEALQSAYGRSLETLRGAWKRELSKEQGFGRLALSFGRELWPMLRPFRWLFVLMLVCNLGAASMALAFPTVLGLIQKSPQQTAFWLGALAVVFVISALLIRAGARISANLSARLLRELQEQLIAHLYHLSHNFYNRRDVQTGDVTSRLMRDLPTVQSALSQMGAAVPQAFMLLGGGAFLLWINPLLGLLILGLVLPGFFVMQRRISKGLETNSRRVGEAAAAVSAHVSESLGAQSFLKAYGLETRRLGEVTARLREQEAASRDLGAVMAALQSGAMLVISFSQVIALALLSSRGQNLTQAVSLLGLVVGPVMGLSGLAQGLQNAPGALRRVRELLDEPIAVQNEPDARPAAPLAREIRFQDVWFAYEAGRPVLQGLSFSIRCGEHVAIVGPSGSGKSTLTNLLLRFWDADEGVVSWDGTDIRHLDVASLRGQMGLVQQDTTVFKATIGENIASGLNGLGEGAVPVERIEEAVSGAQLDEFVRAQFDGLNTPVGERGAQMSGGQRQRLSIARALLRRPSVLVLDEATSALDVVTEREIQATLEHIARGHTTISITHRLSLAARADRILVMEDGKLVEDGPPHELLARKGAYWKLFQAQQENSPVSDAQEPARATQLLGGVPLLSVLQDADLRRLEAAMTRQSAASGQVIVQEGELGDRLYFVLRGSAEAFVGSGESERRVNVLRAGDYFGEMAILEEAPRNATVRALEPSVLLALDRGTFLALLEREPGVRQTVTDNLARRRQALVQTVPVGNN